MQPTDAELITHITRETSLYLDNLQRERLLWADVDGHISASHIAEGLGDEALVSRHLDTVTLLLSEIYGESR